MLSASLCFDHHTPVNTLRLPCPSRCCWLFCCVSVIFFVLGVCLHVFSWSDPIVETFDLIFILVHLFSSVPDSDLDSAFTTSASFLWLLLFLYGSSNRFALIRTFFCFCNLFVQPFEKTGSLVWSISYTLYVFMHYFISFWICYWRTHTFFRF